jgi:hypothetical protein
VLILGLYQNSGIALFGAVALAYALTRLSDALPDTPPAFAVRLIIPATAIAVSLAVAALREAWALGLISASIIFAAQMWVIYRSALLRP